MNPEKVLDLVDYRRLVFEMYLDVRQSDDPAVSCHIWRREKDELFRSHPQSPIPLYERPDFEGLSYFDYDPRARVLASVRYLEKRQPLTIEASEGKLELLRVAKASFKLFSAPRELTLLWFESYGGGMFLSFADATSGKATYGGGRYLLDTVKGADLGGTDEELVLDFNFAYQPSCAYDPRWVCPLAPPENRLNVAIPAGERWNKPRLL